MVLNFSPHQRLIENTSIPGGGEKMCNAESFSIADAAYDPKEQSKEVSCSQRNIGRHFSVVMMPRSLLIFKDAAYTGR